MRNTFLQKFHLNYQKPIQNPLGLGTLCPVSFNSQDITNTSFSENGTSGIAATSSPKTSIGSSFNESPLPYKVEWNTKTILSFLHHGVSSIISRGHFLKTILHYFLCIATEIGIRSLKLSKSRSSFEALSLSIVCCQSKWHLIENIQTDNFIFSSSIVSFDICGC